MAPQNSYEPIAKQKFYDNLLSPIDFSWNNIIKIEESKMNFYVNIDSEYDISEHVGQFEDFNKLVEDVKRQIVEERVVMDE